MGSPVKLAGMIRILLGIVLLLPSVVRAEGMWAEPVRGSWVRGGPAEAGDVDLTRCEIVVAETEQPPVKQAAAFLAGDLQRISGEKVEIVPDSSGKRVAVHLATLAEAAVPQGIDAKRLKGHWEAFRIRTADDGKAVHLVGSNPRGTAFAAYTLCERLGVDPLHHWTGYAPARTERLVLKKTDHFAPPPTFKYRGLFHDDEDILPRPFEHSGYPLRFG